MSDFDLVLADALVIDGTRDATPWPGDIGIASGLIAEMGDLSNRSRDTTVGVGGRVVAPGFIDTHTHAELTAFLDREDATATVAQGVTTIMTGADGFGWVGLSDEERLRWWQDSAAIYGKLPDRLPRWHTPSEFLRDARAASPVSLVPMAPHGNIRAAVMGSSASTPSSAEIDAMRSAVTAWLDAGAVGLASGLDYLPGRYATTDEIVRLCEVVAERGGVYASHLRYSDLGRAAAWREAAEIGNSAGVPVRIAHERLDEEGAALLDEVSSVVDVTIDSYLYPAGCTSLAFHVPPDYLGEGTVVLAERLRSDPILAAELAQQLDPKLAGGPEQEAIIAGTTSGRFEGMTLRGLAQQRGQSVGRVAVSLLGEEMPCALLVYVWQASDESWHTTVKRTLGDARSMIASDGIYHGSHAHPRGFGTFPRVLGQLARDQALISLPTAVHKMTGLPAAAYGLDHRGRIEPGFRADLVLLDPETIAGPGDFESPRRSPIGIDLVLVAGRSVWENTGD